MKKRKKKSGKISRWAGLFLTAVMLMVSIVSVSGIQTVKAASNPYVGGNTNCTWTAWQRANDEANVALPGWGNAGTWYDRAKQAGYSVGTEPRAKSIAVWTDSGTGHVAYVSAVNGSQIYVKEGGYLGGYHEGWTNAYGTRPYTVQTIKGYIYLTANTASSAPQVEHGAYMKTGGTQTIPDGDYHIATAGDRNQCLDVADASKANGANVQIYNAVEDAKQVFTVRYKGNGFYSIMNKNSGKYLDVADGSTAIQTNVQQYAGNGTAAQEWAIHRFDDTASYYTIQARCSGYFLDMADGKTANQTNVQMYKGNRTNAQKWFFIPWGASTGRTISDGDYQIVADSDSSKTMNAEGNGMIAAGNVSLGSSTGDKHQVYRVKYLGDGYYHIANKNSGLLLDLVNAELRNGANVKLWKPNGNNAQKWVIKRSSSGAYNIISKCSGKYLDIAGASFTNGTNIQVWEGNGTNAQKWRFVKWTEPAAQKPDSGSNNTSGNTGTASGGSNNSGTGTSTGGSNNSGTGTSTGDSNSSGTGTSAGGSDNSGTGTSAGGSNSSGTGTSAGGSDNSGTGTSTGGSDNSGTGTSTGENSSGTGDSGTSGKTDGSTGNTGGSTSGSTDKNDKNDTGSAPSDKNDNKTDGSSSPGNADNSQSGGSTAGDKDNSQSGGSNAQQGTDNSGNESNAGSNGNQPGSSVPGNNDNNENIDSNLPGNENSGTDGTSGDGSGTDGSTSGGTDGSTSGGTDGIMPDTPDFPSFGIEPDGTGIDEGFIEVEWNVSSAVLQKGKSTARVKAEVTGDDDIDEYISSDESIVTVTDSGVIKAVNIGTAIVRAVTQKGYTADVTIRVQKNAVTTRTIKVAKKKIQLKPGKIFNLKAQVTPITSLQPITYKSSNKKIVAVNSKGKIKAKKQGTAVIKVTSGKKVVKVRVTVQK